MAADTLSAPLKPRVARARLARIFELAGYFAAAAIVVALVAAGWSSFDQDKFGGEPVVELALDAAPPVVAQSPAGQHAGPPMRNSLQPDAPDQADDVRVTRITPGGVVDKGEGSDDASQPADKAIVRRVGEMGNAPLRPAPDPDLQEKGKNGSLPRIGEDGRRVAEVYARPYRNKGAVGTGAPARIAIMIGGLGISASATDEAIKKLPPEISLAFAPYGRDLQTWVNNARRGGHEVLLQLPMEPFDYPDNDPGPHTLLTSNKANENVQRLHWLMSRFSGYFAVTNYMGAKFTSSSEVLVPVLREIAQRGVAFLDDGSSPRSVAARTGAENGLLSATADLVIDQGQTKAAIDEALRQLEARALENGFALASGTGFPATVQQVAAWAKGLQSRGIVLVPVSAALARQPQS